MMLSISARDRRMLTIGATAIGSLVTLAKGVPAIHEWEVARFADAAAVSEQLEGARAGAERLARLRDTLATRRVRVAELDSVLVSGASPADAVSRLAATLEDIATEQSVKINGLQFRTDSSATRSLATVAVRLTGVADIAGLAAFVHDVETNAAPLVVRDLSVVQSEPMAAESRPEALRIDVLVETAARITGGRRP